MAADVVEAVNVSVFVPDEEEVPAKHLHRQHSALVPVEGFSGSVGKSYLERQVVTYSLEARNEAGYMP